MSKHVKQLEFNYLQRGFEGVEDVLIVNVIGMNSQETYSLRSELRKRGINLQVVKNSLARRVLSAKGLPALEQAFSGPSAIAWGGEGIVELAKEITSWAKKLEKFEVKGGCVSGQALDPKGIEALSKLPTRVELLSQLVGRILSPGANLSAQLLAPGGLLASQIKSKSEQDEPTSPAAA